MSFKNKTHLIITNGKVCIDNMLRYTLRYIRHMRDVQFIAIC